MSSTEDEGHSSLIKTPIQLLTVVLAAFLFPVVIIFLLAQLVTGDMDVDHSSPAYSDEAVAERLDPVGELVLASDSPPIEAQPTDEPDGAAAEATALAVDAGEEKIEAIYAASCAACHATGAGGAPKLGDKAAWSARIQAGSEALYDSAIKGKNAMPPKGGNASLSDADVMAVVDYMVSQSK